MKSQRVISLFELKFKFPNAVKFIFFIRLIQFCVGAQSFSLLDNKKIITHKKGYF